MPTARFIRPALTRVSDEEKQGQAFAVFLNAGHNFFKGQLLANQLAQLINEQRHRAGGGFGIHHVDFGFRVFGAGHIRRHAGGGIGGAEPGRNGDGKAAVRPLHLL